MRGYPEPPEAIVSVDTPVFQSTEPGTGEVVGTFPVMTADEVAVVDQLLAVKEQELLEV